MSKKRQKKQVFKNDNIYILLYGLIGHTTRYEALRKDLPALGAKLWDKIPTKKDCFVVTDLSIEKLIVAKGVDIDIKDIKSGRLKIIRPDWISQCKTSNKKTRED
jgi:hypothetical protein